MYLPHAVATVNIVKTSDSLNAADKKRCLNKNVKLFPHMNVVMTLHSLVMTKQDKDVWLSAPYFKEQKADEGRKPYNSAKSIILPMLVKPILNEYLTVTFPQPEFTRFYAMQINKLNLIKCL